MAATAVCTNWHGQPTAATAAAGKIVVIVIFASIQMPARTLLVMIFFISGAARAASSLEQDLIQYNHLQLSKDAQVVDSTDNGERAAFRDYHFECRKEADFEDTETPVAKAAFDRFLAYVAAHPSPTVEQKTQRLALLQAAITAGSWRADYLDVIWGMWDNRGDGKALKPFADRLYAYTTSGLPVAVHAWVEWHGGMYEDMPQRVALLKAAIERGNTNAMVSVAYNLGTHDLALRPMAKQMLDCAAAQGAPGAYDGIGRLAWQEGRWVDAMRAWIKGANLGCDECLVQVESDLVWQPGHRVSDGTYNTDPGYKALRKFYEDQFFYGLTHLHSLRVTAPASLQIDVSDEQIVKGIKARIAAYGLP